MRKTRNAAISVSALGLVALLGAAPAHAASGDAMGDLRPVNDANASGRAVVAVQGDKLTVHLQSQGLLPDQPHAAHIHFGKAARHECPTAADDKDGNGHISTTEGAPAYGPIVVSLTKTGDTSPKSGLAIDRFDTAPGGKINYERGSIKVTHDVAQAILRGQSVVVVHGVDYNGDHKYSGNTKSDLDPKLPTEATDPAICGVMAASQMSAMPNGGVQAGSGSTAGVENLGVMAGGGAALLAGAALLVNRRALARRAGAGSRP